MNINNITKQQKTIHSFMDVCMIDITNIPNVHEGDEVIIFNDELTISELALKTDTIPYEILTGVSQRVKRVYFSE